MDASGSAAIDDATLVAFVHGELDEPTARAVRDALRRDAALRERHAVLAAVDRALLEALDAPRTSRRGGGVVRSLVALAAAAVVLAMWWTGRDLACARNDVVELQAAPRGGASQPLFTEVALELRWRNRLTTERGKGVAVLPAGPGDLLPTLAASHQAASERAGFAPVVVRARFVAPDGRTHAGWLRPKAEPQLVTTTSLQTVLLTDFLWQRTDPPPYFGGKPGDREWVEDFLWAYREAPYGEPRAVPDLPGEWRIELRVESVPPPSAGAWPTFDEPLVVQTAVVLTGLASAWGTAHDGMQARLLVATGCKDLDRAPMALQLRNGSGRTRRYNIAGTTLAKIPQPFHFAPFVGDGRSFGSCEPRDGVGVIHSGDDLMREHPDGTTRTLVFGSHYFTPKLSQQPLDDLLFVQFHFEATTWLATDTELWQGKIDTGTLPLRQLRP